MKTLLEDSEQPQKFNKSILLMLDPKGRDCEVCGKHMYDHDWAILDYQGFVLECSNEIKQKG